MKFLLLSVLSLSAIFGFAQQSPALKLARENRLFNSVPNSKESKDTLHVYLGKPRNIDNMPIAKVGNIGQVFLYNNGKGLNIYKSQPDNMPVAKPDGSYKDDMCTKSKLDMQKVINAMEANKENPFQPEGNSKYNFLMPAYKDSLPYIDSASKLLLKPKF